jgi:hypothetical protein
MTDQHPITPPLVWINEWEEDWHHSKVKHIELEPYIAAQAAQWGADQELEACCEWLEQKGFAFVDEIRAARRFKPQSLKEQALLALSHLVKGADDTMDTTEAAEYIRRALEQLDD